MLTRPALLRRRGLSVRDVQRPLPVPGDGCHRFDENGSEGFGAGRLHKQFDVVHHRSQDAHVHLPSRVRIVSHLRFLIPSPDTDQTPSGNNIAHLNTPPNYKSTWGFNDGAQNDIFVAATKPAPTTYIVNPYATPTGTTVAGGTPTATALPSGWVSYGCSTDQDSPRVLNGPSVASDNNTISGCTSSCAYQGYTWAGVEYGRGMSCHPSCRAPFSPPKRDAGSWLMRHRVLVWFFGLDQPHQQLQLQRPMLWGPVGQVRRFVRDRGLLWPLYGPRGCGCRYPPYGLVQLGLLHRSGQSAYPRQ